jgi:hypothetical protein
MNSPERQTQEQNPIYYYSETKSEYGISLMIQDSLLGRLEEVKFFHEEIDSWLRSKGELSHDLQPLTIALIDDHFPVEANGSKTQASYQSKDDKSLIRIYMKDRLVDFDIYAVEFEHDVREDSFNYQLNKSCVHEIEHWIQRSNGQTDTVVRQGILDIFSNFETDMEKVGENKAGEIAIRNLVQLVKKEKNYETYYNRPIEIQAREASDTYPSKHGPMIWCKIRSRH